MDMEKTILVVEDNKLNMKLIRGLLKISRFNMLEAFDAESGIEMAGKFKPDLILMDIQLPCMDGLEATRIIKRKDELKHIPVIALTSYAMEGDRAKAMDAGCADYITKPISTQGLLSALNKYLT